MNQLPLQVIRRTFNVFDRLVKIPLLFDEVIVNGRIDEDALRNLETTLIQMRRLDLVHVFRQTMQGNAYNLLGFFEGGGGGGKSRKWRKFSRVLIDYC